MKHLLSLEKLPRADFEKILRDAAGFKRERGHHKTQPLAGQTWALMFSKSSTRTRVSFEVGIHELGGRPMFLNANDIQLGRGEPIKDTARVLGRMIHGAVIRTFAQADVEEFARFRSRNSGGRLRARWLRSLAMARATWRTRGFGRRQNSDLNCALPRPKNSSRPPPC
jgi:ornithine carbamoyltransferase